jgi:hypothetical protein
VRIKNFHGKSSRKQEIFTNLKLPAWAKMSRRRVICFSGGLKTRRLKKGREGGDKMAFVFKPLKNNGA